MNDWQATPLTIIPPTGAFWAVSDLPPSVNHTYENAVAFTEAGKRYNRRRPTAQALAWKEAIGWQLKARYRGDLALVAPKPPLEMLIRLLVRSPGRQDVDNCGKLCLDAMIPPFGLDDKTVKRLVIEKELLPARTGGPVRCEMILWSVWQQMEDDRWILPASPNSARSPSTAKSRPTRSASIIAIKRR